MAGGEETGPIVRFPERVDRRARLGPFPSPRDALRFLCYAAVGALLSPWLSPFLWLPLLAAGFTISVWQPDGQAFDDRAVAVLRWKWRTWRPGRDVNRVRRSPEGRDLVVLPEGVYATIIECSGVPVAYLPPVELERSFGRFRNLLREMNASFACLCTASPIRTAPLVPGIRPQDPEEREAADAYSELVGLLCRRRRVRRILIALRSSGAGGEVCDRLRADGERLAERLRELGVSARRLAGASLLAATYRLDWARPGEGP
jgi:hypothetical protein